MRERVAILIALLASSGCSGSDDPPTTTPRSEGTSAPTTSTPTVRSHGAEATPGPEATPESQALPVVALGREVVATPPSQSSRAAQERAERAEAAGDLEVAIRAWRDALVETPDFDAAHFELARLLARQGAEDEAESEVRVALLHDVGRFLVRFREDPAFVRLRERPALQTFVRALESAFAQAVAEGMPLIEARTVQTSPAPYDVMLGDAETFEARGALWVQAWHRFVLVSPPRRQARWAHVDRERRRSIVVSSGYDTMPDVGYYLAHARIDVYALEPAVAPIASWAAGPTWMVRLDLERPNLGVCVTDLWSGEDSCRELGAGEARTIASDGLSLDLDVSIRGEFPSARPAEAARDRVEGESLVTPSGSIALGPTQGARPESEVLRSADDARAVVIRCSCRSRREPWPRCAVDAIDLGGREAHRLLEDVHHVRAVFDADGALYVQSRHGGEAPPSATPDVLLRVGAPGTPAETLPSGLVLGRVLVDPCWPISDP